MNDNVSDEQLLMDIRNTELEMDAYRKLGEGFLILSDLPENKGLSESFYNREFQKYFKWEKECSDLLQKLIHIKIERGIPEENCNVRAPWTDEQVEMLDKWQDDGTKHPYTCICGESLTPYNEGWICEYCGHKQDWCWKGSLE
jgi:hypothetical protein